MDRYRYDLSHQVHTCSDVGCLTTLSTIPIVAGDSMKIDIEGLWRLSPLRRSMTMDAMVDVYGFFVPYRHVWGQQWIDFIKQGVDEEITLALGPGHAVDGDVNRHAYLGTRGFPSGAGRSPKWIQAGYNMVWNRYFRAPTYDEDLLDDDELLEGERRQATGRPIARLKTIWNTGVKAEVNAADRQVTVSGNKLDLLDVEQIRARFKTERDREFFAQRYNDVMGKVWGTGVNIDADQRPELLMRNSFWLSGYDVDGTSDSTLGQFSGKSSGVGGMSIPKKYFNEHGTVWLMASLRFPSVHSREFNYLDKKSQPTYDDIAGDPDIIKVKPPIPLDLGKYIRTAGGASEDVLTPYGQHYRYNTNRVHPRFDELQGYMFQRDFMQTRRDQIYVIPENYDSSFQTDQLYHWNTSMNVNVMADRPIPGPLSSIYAGTN